MTRLFLSFGLIISSIAVAACSEKDEEPAVIDRLNTRPRRPPPADPGLDPSSRPQIRNSPPPVDRSGERLEARPSIHTAQEVSPATPVEPERARPEPGEPQPAVESPRAVSSRELPPPELNTIGGLSLDRLVLSTAIEDREPAGAATEFSLDEERVFAFLQLENSSNEATTITVKFEPIDEAPGAPLTLEVPANQGRWRTWAFTRQIRTAGRWFAVAYTEDGEVLGRAGFDVVE